MDPVIWQRVIHEVKEAMRPEVRFLILQTMQRLHISRIEAAHLLLAKADEHFDELWLLMVKSPEHRNNKELRQVARKVMLDLFREPIDN